MSILGIRLVNTALFVLSCFLVANLVVDVGVGLIPETAAAPRSVLPPDPVQHSWEERQQILDRNLFGAQIVSGEIEEEPEPELDEELEKTRLPLKLLGTISSEDQLVASAAIENTQRRLHQVLKVGDTLAQHAQVVVARIDRGRVILQNGGQREELLLDKDIHLHKTAARSFPRRTSRRNSPPRPKPAEVENRLKQLADRGGDRSATKLLTQARVLPKLESGQMVGIELSQIKPGSFYEKVGIRDGDIVTSINGVMIDNPTASKQLLESFGSAKEFVAEVTGSDGSRREIRADAEMLNEMMSGDE